MKSNVVAGRRQAFRARSRSRLRELCWRKLQVECLEKRFLMASDWQNPLYALDVDDDSSVSPLDVLVVINEINRGGSRPLQESINLQAPTVSYLDVDGDRSLSPLDVLTVINAINQGANGAGLSLSLVNDRGSSATDRITNDPRVKGSVQLNGTSVRNARARIDRGDVFPIDTLPDGSLLIDPRRIQSIPDKNLRIAVAIEKTDGSTSLNQLRYTYDATPPRFIAPRLVAEDDTGSSDRDGVTRINNPRVELFAEAGSQLTIEFQGNVLHDGPSDGVWTTQLAILNDGTYNLLARASDLAGNISQAPFPFQVTIDTQVPGPLSLDLAPSSDSGVQGDRQTHAGRVMLLGTTEPNARVTIVDPEIRQSAASDGKVRLPSVVLRDGDNTLDVVVEDLAGNRGPISSNLFHKTAGEIPSDPVDSWMRIGLDAIRFDATDPPMATRSLAMLSMTMLEITQALDGLPARMVRVSSPTSFSVEAAIASGATHVLSYLFPAQTQRLAIERDNALATIPEGPDKQNGVLFGLSVAQALIALRTDDGWDAFEAYEGKHLPGYWVPTEPMYAVAIRPRWPEVEPWSVTSIDALRPDGPPDMSSREYSRDFNEVKSLGSATSSARTSEQTSIAIFWSNGPGTSTPPGQWNTIALQVAGATSASLGEKARLFATLNASLADAAIAGWDAKYHYEFWRPVTAIHQADQDENVSTATDGAWRPLLITPAFPEYVSGHSTFSATAATILTKEFGEGFAFTTGSDSLPNTVRSYPDFDSAAREAGRSRIYGGIHYEFSNRDGQLLGRNVANQVWNDFANDVDIKPPVVRIASPVNDFITSSIPTIEGRVFDNLSGVRGLQASADGQAFVDISIDPSGRFTWTPQLEPGLPREGLHEVRFRAIDAVGNISSDHVMRFTLDERTPSIDWQTPRANDSVHPDILLMGTLDGTGSQVVAMTYRIDGGSPIPIRRDPSNGRFDQRIDWSRSAPGPHTITIEVEDAAGNRSTQSRTVDLTRRVPFTIASTIPESGSVDVGTTLRPRVFFSRPIDTSTLNNGNFFATGPDGEKLSTKIVPATDGSFAWLFFEQPMPSNAIITIHIDGDSILASDGSRLDADGNGADGGDRVIRFKTVSLSPLVGTSLTGRVVDPGVDLLPMTWDDIRSGPDRTLHTSDDLFLNPIAGVEVFILGMEGNRVTTDAQGRFHFDRVPAGNVKLAIVGRTATNAPSGFYFPEMVMDLNLRAGEVNTVMGSMGTLDQQLANADRSEVYLPRLSTTMLQDLNPTTSTRIEVADKDAPDLTPEQRSRLTLTIPPGIAVDVNGAPIVGGRVGVSTVPPELVREMLPPGLLQHTFDITIQAPGIDRFTSPIPMTFPNLAGAAPGTSLQFLSFDHTTGRLVIEGTGTVSADGLTVSTDPGNGITHPGWHGWIQESNDTGDYDDSYQECSFDSSGGSGNGEGEDACDDLIDPIPHFPDLQNRLFVDDKDEFDLRFGNLAIPLGRGVRPLVVELTVDDEALQFLTGLETQTFELRSLQAKTLRVSVTDKLDALRFFDRDEFWGTRLHVKAYPKGKPQEVLWDQTNYIYRYVDALDAVTPERATDGILDFPDALADGAQGIFRSRPVTYYMNNETRPGWSIQNKNFYQGLFWSIRDYRG